MTRIAWFHPFSGIAGDMALGALIDAGAPLTDIVKTLTLLDVPGWTLTTERVQRGGIRATRAVVTAEPSPQSHRPYREIRDLIARAPLPDRVLERAGTVFRKLAEAEGGLHGQEPDDVELHEVGALDAIIDVVGVCAALELLDIDEVRSGPVAQGTGMTRSQHGPIPIPAPATLALLAGAPTYGLEIAAELTTPTGAALLAGLVSGFGALPAITVTAVGYGAGTRDLAQRPNVVQIVVGDAATVTSLGGGQPAVLLEANVDDATGEALAHAIARLVDAGAYDAWVTPIVMKKGRPAHTVHALCDETITGSVATVLTRETGSLGVRGSRVERWPHARDEATVEVDGQPIRVKIGAGRIKVEHDDAAAAAWALGLPLREVLSRAEEAGRHLTETPEA